jgi:hypothetical protein
VVLEEGDARTIEENVLPRARVRLFLFDLHFEHARGVLDDFGDVGDVARCG